MNVADHSLLHHLLGFDVERVGSILRTYLHDLAGLLRRIHNVPPLFDGVGQRFFEVDVLTGVQGGHRHLVVQVLRRTNKDYVDGRIAQHLAIIHVGLWGVASLGLNGVLRPVQVARVGIAHGRDGHQFRHCLVHHAHNVVAAAPRANPANLNFFVRAKRRQNGRAGRKRYPR